MTFDNYAKEKRTLIEANLKNFLKYKKNNNLPKIFAEQNVISNLQDFILRGKLMRGTLFLFGCEMLGKKIDSKLLDIAVGIEIAHSSLLIHDDIIDNDVTRRGEKTIFAKYIDRGMKISAIDPIHYGKSIGIVAGDVGFFLGLELFSKSQSPLNSEILKYYANEILIVALAEGVDSELGQIKKEASRDEIYSVYRLKTARYTFSLPLVMAGIVCNAKTKTIGILDKLGENAGIIFQIKDDEIGLFGKAKQIGKPVGSDIRENKKTLIRAVLFDKATSKEKVRLGNYFGNAKVTSKQIKEVISLCKKYNVLDELQRETDLIMKRVWDLYELLDIKIEYKAMLKELLEFNLKRTF